MTKKEQTAAEIVKAARDKNKISARELQPIRERRRKNGSPATLAVRHLPVTVKPNG